MLESNGGRVVTIADSFLGLRHGPMAAVGAESLIVAFLSSDPVVRAYERDVLLELRRKGLGGWRLVVGERIPPELAAEPEDVRARGERRGAFRSTTESSRSSTPWLGSCSRFSAVSTEAAGPIRPRRGSSGESSRASRSMPANNGAKRVLVVGEINVDLICQGYHAFPSPGREVLVDDFQMVLGSASAICAMGLARLGTPVVFFGKVGDDPSGHFCLDAMRARDIDLTHAVVDPAVKTGVTVAITSPTDRALVSFLGSIASLTEKEVPRDLFSGAASRPRLLLLPPGGAPPGSPEALPGSAGGGPDDLARSRLRPERALGAGPSRDARRQPTSSSRTRSSSAH